MRRIRFCALSPALFSLACVACAHAPGGNSYSAVDHHLHTFDLPDVTDETEQILDIMSAAGYDEGVILSEAFSVTYGEGAFDAPTVATEVRAENQFIADQVAASSRLTGFFSFNPLHPSALAEIDYWGSAGGFRGVKLHLSNADVDFQDPDDLAALKAVFERCVAYDFALVIHLRSRETFTVSDVENFIAQLPEESLRIQLAHMAGWGSYDQETLNALETFAKHIAADDPRTRFVQFDTAGAVPPDITPEQAEGLAALMRRIGLDRFVFGSDYYFGSQLRPERAWANLTRYLPLTDKEFVALRRNHAYYLDTPRKPAR